MTQIAEEELPTINCVSTNNACTYTCGEAGVPSTFTGLSTAGNSTGGAYYEDQVWPGRWHRQKTPQWVTLPTYPSTSDYYTTNITNIISKEPIVTEQKRRLVQMFIVDPDRNLDVKDCVLHQTDPQLTDLTDQELFYELEIKSLLKKHNELRAKTLDKKRSEAKDKDVYLEAIRIKDLRMIVQTLVEF